MVIDQVWPAGDSFKELVMVTDQSMHCTHGGPQPCKEQTLINGASLYWKIETVPLSDQGSEKGSWSQSKV